MTRQTDPRPSIDPGRRLRRTGRRRSTAPTTHRRGRRPSTVAAAPNRPPPAAGCGRQTDRRPPRVRTHRTDRRPPRVRTHRTDRLPPPAARHRTDRRPPPAARLRTILLPPRGLGGSEQSTPPAAGVDAGTEAPNRPPPPAVGVDAAGAPNRPPPLAGVDAAGAPNRPPPAGVGLAGAPNSPPPAAGAGLAGAPKRPPPAAGAGLAGAPKPPVNSGERSNDVGQRDVVVRRRERGARACRERTESESVVGKGNIIHWEDPRDGRGVMHAPNAGVAGVAGAPNMSARDPSRRFNPACVWRAAPTTLARTTQRSRLFPLPPRSHRVCSKKMQLPWWMEREHRRTAVCTPWSKVKAYNSRSLTKR